MLAGLQLGGGDTAMNVNCYLINHDGEGERGEKVQIRFRQLESAAWYAERAAELFHGQEMHENPELTDSDFNDTSLVIELDDYPFVCPMRYRVYCHVQRTYEAHPVDNH